MGRWWWMINWKGVYWNRVDVLKSRFQCFMEESTKVPKTLRRRHDRYLNRVFRNQGKLFCGKKHNFHSAERVVMRWSNVSFIRLRLHQCCRLDKRWLCRNIPYRVTDSITYFVGWIPRVLVFRYMRVTKYNLYCLYFKTAGLNRLLVSQGLWSL
jgi:hypothetical protein